MLTFPGIGVYQGKVVLSGLELNQKLFTVLVNYLSSSAAQGTRLANPQTCTSLQGELMCIPVYDTYRYPHLATCVSSCAHPKLLLIETHGILLLLLYVTVGALYRIFSSWVLSRVYCLRILF